MHVSNCVWGLRKTHELIVPSTAFWEKKSVGPWHPIPKCGKALEGQAFPYTAWGIEGLPDDLPKATRTEEMRSGGTNISVQCVAYRPMPVITHVRPEAYCYPCQLRRVSSTVFTCQGSNFRSLSATFWVLKIYLFLSSKPQRCFMNVTPIKQEGPGHTSKFSADCLLWSMFGQLNHQNHPFESIHLNFFPSPLNQVTAQNAQGRV